MDLPFSLNVLGMGFDTSQMEKADLVHLHWIGGRTVDFTRLSHIRRPLVYTPHDMFACTAGATAPWTATGSGTNAAAVAPARHSPPLPRPSGVAVLPGAAPSPAYRP